MEVFEAIAQPTRREILRLLAGGELSAGNVAARFDVTQPAISQHLKVLREAGLVDERRDGTRRLYRVRAEGLGDLHSFLADVMPGRLDRLKQAAEAEERRDRASGARRNYVVEHEVWVAARPETVFAYFTDPQKLASWIGAEATLDPRPGGVCRIAMNGAVMSGEFVEVVPHSRVVLSWGWEEELFTCRPRRRSSRWRWTPTGTARACA